MFRLTQKFPDREIILNCWLPSAGLKMGYQVRLEAYPTEWWTITGASPNEVEKNTLHTDWAVGGLKGDFGRKK